MLKLLSHVPMGKSHGFWLLGWTGGKPLGESSFKRGRAGSMRYFVLTSRLNNSDVESTDVFVHFLVVLFPFALSQAYTLSVACSVEG